MPWHLRPLQPWPGWFDRLRADQFRMGYGDMFSHGGNQLFVGVSPGNQTAFAMNHFARN